MQKLIKIGGYMRIKEEELKNFLNDVWKVIHQTPIRQLKGIDTLYLIIEKNTRK